MNYTACTAISKPSAPASSDTSVSSCLILLNSINCLRLPTLDPVFRREKVVKFLCGPGKGLSLPLFDLLKALSP
jgi:hypothetical protein